ncbi:MAG TPA: M48 family metalloprotease [Acidimicrobiales bacterium]|nr:M48 family metalloprotease [Acidimicrobiales bacterium]
MTTSTTIAGGGQLVAAPLPVEADPHHEAHRPHPTPQAAGMPEALATACALVVCVLAQLPHRILEATGTQAWGLALVVAVAVVGGARALARAPFNLPRALDGRPDRGTALRQWAGSEAKIMAASVAVGLITSVPLYFLLRSTPAWWVWAWLMFAALTVAWQLATPLALRAQAGPLAPAPAMLAARVQALAVRAGVDLGGGVALAGKPGSRRCNAYVVGLGPTRRVVLEQSVAAWPAAVVDQVVAHELGHWRLGHAARRLPLTILAQLVSLAAAAAVLSYGPVLDWAGLTDAGDPRSYPLLLVLGAVVVFPARCLLAWRDRCQERAADSFALTLLEGPDDFAAMLQLAADEGGAPRHLPWWGRLTASHPPIDERAARAHPSGI